MTICHPPNKQQFVVAGGLTHLMKMLKMYPDDGALNMHALSLLYCIISDDSKAKMSMAQVRHSVMADGAVLIIENAQKKFRDLPNVSQLCANIWSLLMSDFS